MMGPSAFDTERQRLEELAPFGLIAEVAPGRFAFRLGVKLERKETNLDATSRVLGGVGGLLQHLSAEGRCRGFRSVEEGWVGAASNDPDELEVMMKAVWPLTLGTVAPPAVGLRLVEG